MKKQNFPLLIIIASFILIVLNFIFESNIMNIGFWLRIIIGVLLIFAMLFTILERRKVTNENSK